MVLPFYAMPKTPADVQKFRRDIAEQLKWLQGNQYNEDYTESHLPLYPEPGGLLPFLNDIDGPLYCLADPEAWPICCWLRRPIVTRKGMSIADMFVGFLERSPNMVRVWGDVNEMEPHRLYIADCCSD